jgi:hypothetical protein
MYVTDLCLTLPMVILMPLLKNINVAPHWIMQEKRLPLVPSQTFSVGTDYLIPCKIAFTGSAYQMNITYSGTGKLYWSESNEAFQKYYGSM